MLLISLLIQAILAVPVSQVYPGKCFKQQFPLLLKMSCHSEVSALDVQGTHILAGIMGQDLNQPTYNVGDPTTCNLNHTNHFAVAKLTDSTVQWMTYFNVKPSGGSQTEPLSRISSVKISPNAQYFAAFASRQNHISGVLTIFDSSGSIIKQVRPWVYPGGFTYRGGGSDNGIRNSPHVYGQGNGRGMVIANDGTVFLVGELIDGAQTDRRPFVLTKVSLQSGEDKRWYKDFNDNLVFSRNSPNIPERPYNQFCFSCTVELFDDDGGRVVVGGNMYYFQGGKEKLGSMATLIQTGNSGTTFQAGSMNIVMNSYQQNSGKYDVPVVTFKKKVGGGAWDATFGMVIEDVEKNDFDKVVFFEQDGTAMTFPKISGALEIQENQFAFRALDLKMKLDLKLAFLALLNIEANTVNIITIGMNLPTFPGMMGFYPQVKYIWDVNLLVSPTIDNSLYPSSLKFGADYLIYSPDPGLSMYQLYAGGSAKSFTSDQTGIFTAFMKDGFITTINEDDGKTISGYPTYTFDIYTPATNNYFNFDQEAYFTFKTDSFITIPVASVNHVDWSSNMVMGNAADIDLGSTTCQVQQFSLTPQVLFDTVADITQTVEIGDPLPQITSFKYDCLDIQVSLKYQFIKSGDVSVSYTDANHALDSQTTVIAATSTVDIQFNKAEYIGQWTIWLQASHLTDTSFVPIDSTKYIVNVIDSICNTDTNINLLTTYEPATSIITVKLYDDGTTTYPVQRVINQFKRSTNTIYDKCKFFKYKAEYLSTGVDITRTSDPALTSQPNYVAASVAPPASNPIAFDEYTRTVIISNPSDKTVFKTGGLGYQTIKITGYSSHPLYTAQTTSINLQVRWTGDNLPPTISQHAGIKVMQLSSDSVIINPLSISDPENNNLVHSWDTTALPSSILTQVNSLELKVSPEIFTVAGIYVIKFKVTEEEQALYENVGNPLSAEISINVEILRNSKDPVFTSKPADIIIHQLDSSTLTFESSMYNHPFNFDLIAGWDIADSPIASALTIMSDSQIKIDPLLTTTPGMYQLQYKITEKEQALYSNIGSPNSATSTINVRIVEKNTAPVIGEKPKDIIVTKNKVGQVIIDISKITDPQGHPFTTSWIIPSDIESICTIQGLSVVQISPTLETPTGEYFIEFTVQEDELASSYNIDNALTTTHKIKITIVEPEPVTPPPVVPDVPTIQTQIEQNAVVDQEEIQPILVPVKIKKPTQETINIVKELKKKTPPATRETKEIDRKPIKLKLFEFSQNGQVRLTFSEKLFDINNYNPLNVSTISNELFFDLNYKYNAQSKKVPQLVGWNVTNMTNYEIIFQLNFTERLYISQGSQKDTLTFKYLIPEIFKATSDGYLLKQNYTLKVLVPPQMASEAEFLSKQNVGGKASTSMDLTFAVPLLFQLFFSFSMNLIWALFNMLQLVTNITRLERIRTPANVVFILTIIDGTVNFKLFQQPFVKEFIDKHMQGIQTFVDKQGFVVIGALGLLTILGLTFLSQRLFKKSKFVQKIVIKIKRKLMWSSVFRSLLQGYLTLSVLSWTQLSENEFNNGDSTSIILPIKLIVIVILPVGAIIILKKLRYDLTKPEIKASYSTLYQNIKISEFDELPLWNTTLFLAKRLFIALLTVFGQQYPLSQISAYIGFSLFSLSFVSSIRPMDSKFFNLMEILNEGFVLMTGYYMLLYTDIVPDVEVRYSIGEVYYYKVITIIVMNLLIIISMMLLGVIKAIRLRCLRRKYRQELKNKKYLDSSSSIGSSQNDEGENQNYQSRDNNKKKNKIKQENQEFTFGDQVQQARLPEPLKRPPRPVKVPYVRNVENRLEQRVREFLEFQNKRLPEDLKIRVNYKPKNFGIQKNRITFEQMTKVAPEPSQIQSQNSSHSSKKLQESADPSRSVSNSSESSSSSSSSSLEEPNEPPRSINDIIEQSHGRDFSFSNQLAQQKMLEHIQNNPFRL